MTDSLEDLRKQLEQFARERDWEKFHTPRSLLIAMVGEVGELAEHMQWRSDDEIKEFVETSPGETAEELADISIYLIRLADVLGIDLGAAIDEKIARNAERFSVEEVYGRAGLPDAADGDAS